MSSEAGIVDQFTSTGYEGFDIFDSLPGFEVAVRVSPDAYQIVIEEARQEEVDSNKIIGGYLYAFFEAKRDVILEYLSKTSVSSALVWVVHFADSELATYFVAERDRLSWYLIADHEFHTLQSHIEAEIEEVDLGWASFVFGSKSDC